MTKAPALFGVGSTSLGVFADQYRVWHRRRNKRRKNKLDRPSLIYVPHFKQAIKTGDVYLIETVPVFVKVRSQIPDTAAVVISDSPLLLSELPGLRPLDWVKDVWRLRMNPVDFSVFETQREHALKAAPKDIWLHAAPHSIDRLGLIIDETASGTLLTPLNSVMFQLSFADRVHFRKALANYLSGALELAAFETAARNLITQSQSDNQLSLKNLTKVVGMLKTQGPLYQQAITSMIAKKSPNKFIKDTKVTPFEIRYLTRMVTSNAK